MNDNGLRGQDFPNKAKAGMADGKKRVGKKEEEPVGRKFLDHPPLGKQARHSAFFATPFFAKRIGGLVRISGLNLPRIQIDRRWSDF